MIGKKNIAFGFIFLIFSAGLGPYMASKLSDASGGVQTANAAKRTALGKLQQMQQAKFKDEIEDKPVTVTQLGTVLANSIRAIDGVTKARQTTDLLKSGPHAHGNLESMLNIVVGLVLFFIAAPVLIKQAISWLMILGTLLHSGILYLSFYPPLQMGWAQTVMGWGLGPVMIMLSLVLMAVASVLWLKGEVVQD